MNLRAPVKRFGKFLLWFVWLYPLLRGLLIFPMIIAEAILPKPEMAKFIKLVSVVHGGRPVYDFLITWYLLFFIVSLIVYFVWHFRTKTRITWPRRLLLALIILFNFSFPFFTIVAAVERDERARQQQEASEETTSEDAARALFSGEKHK